MPTSLDKYYLTGSKFNLIFFDLDGTLTDTYKDIAAAANVALRQLGLPQIKAEAIKTLIGGGARLLLERILKHGGIHQLDQVVKIFLDAYSKQPLQHTTLYPGVYDVLRSLTSVKKVVLSNKPEKISRQILEGLGVINLFDFVAGGDTFKNKKPDPLPVLKILEMLKTLPKDSLIVGDSITDIQTARAAGIKVCAVSYGYSQKGELDSADWIIDKIDDLVGIIL